MDMGAKGRLTTLTEKKEANSSHMPWSFSFSEENRETQYKPRKPMAVNGNRHMPQLPWKCEVDFDQTVLYGLTAHCHGSRALKPIRQMPVYSTSIGPSWSYLKPRPRILPLRAIVCAYKVYKTRLSHIAHRRGHRTSHIADDTGHRTSQRTRALAVAVARGACYGTGQRSPAAALIFIWVCGWCK